MCVILGFDAPRALCGHDYMESFRPADAPAKGPSEKQNPIVPFSKFFELVAFFKAAFVEDLCFYTFRTVAYMSHQSVSEPSFPQLRKIMSGGTLGLCLDKQPVASCSLPLQHFSAIKWHTVQD